MLHTITTILQLLLLLLPIVITNGWGVVINKNNLPTTTTTTTTTARGPFASSSSFFTPITSCPIASSSSSSPPHPLRRMTLHAIPSTCPEETTNNQSCHTIRNDKPNAEQTTSEQQQPAMSHHLICHHPKKATSSQVTSSSSSSSSRRTLLRGALCAITTTGMYYYSSSTIPSAALAYTINKVEPNELDIYTEAQQKQQSSSNDNDIDSDSRPLRVLWVGSGDLTGVTKNLFPPGNEVTAVDLIRPTRKELRTATTYATEHGYQLTFEQGDATKLKFTDDSFDVVVCSMFLCQDFNPAVVVSEIRRVLKPNGRFGFYEHVEDIDEVIVGKVFGEASVVKVEYYKEIANVMAGVVRKV